MKINVIAVLVNAVLIGNVAHAEGSYHFNPAFLDGENGNVADLSWVGSDVELPPGEYNVGVYVNDTYILNQTLPFAVETGEKGVALQPCFTPSVLQALGLNLAAAGYTRPAGEEQPCLYVDQVFPGAKTTLDTKNMAVTVTAPQRYLLNLPRGYVSPESREHGITAAWLSYVLNGSHNDYQGGSDGGRRKDSRYFASLNSGVNLGAWRLRDYTTWTHGGDGTNSLTHVRTWLQRDVAPLRSQLYLGESYTSATLFDSVGLRGVQMSTDDNMLPSSQRGYAPEVRGIARSNATVTVRQNGHVVYQTSVPAGAFELKDLYPTSSGGDLEVTIEEENGYTTRYVVPFASVPNLMRQGQLKYSAAVGRFRPVYQQDNPLFFQGDLFYGWRYGLTFYGGAQVSGDYRALALGVGQNMGRPGALSVDVTQARSRLADDSQHTGESVRVRYSKTFSDYGTRLNLSTWRFTDSGFYTLSDTARRAMSGGETVEETGADGTVTTVYQNTYNLRYARKARDQAMISQTLGDYGSLSLTWDRQSYWQSSQTTESVQAAWNSTFGKVSWSLGLQSSTRLNSSGRDNIVSLTLSVPLGDPALSTRARYGMTQSSSSGTTHSAGLSGYVPGSDRATYSVSQRYSGQQKYGADAALQYQGPAGNYNLGYSSSSQSRYLNYGVSGGMVLHEDGLTLSQPLGNTSILVKAPGAAHVALRGYRGVETDRRGYAVIPYATPYRVNRVELDVTTAGEQVEIENAIDSRVPTEGAMVRATIATRTGKKAMFFLRREDRTVLPFGTVVSLKGSTESAGIVGDGGGVYLSGLPDKGVLTARWGNGNGAECRVSYRLDDKSRNAVTGLWTQELVCGR